MQMPIMDGPTLLRTIRNDKAIKQPKFVFTTGGVNVDLESDKCEFATLIDGYILKPFIEEKILEILNQCFLSKEKKAA